MEDQLSAFISEKSFPCIMAKSVLKKGFLSFNQLERMDDTDVLKRMYPFINSYRQDQDKLSSFIVSFDDPEYMDFDYFEADFWPLLRAMDERDKEEFSHDPRVSSDPEDPRFSFSIMEEAFFILALHPQSPRFSRRFSKPAIVFNPHRQFENLRARKLFKKVRNTIRGKDKLLQGFINPMMADFGERSEVYQYTGRQYQLRTPNPYIYEGELWKSLNRDMELASL